MSRFSETIPQTMFDFKDYYNFVAEEMPNDCRIAEIGNADGASAIYLAEKLQELGKNFTLQMIDSCAYGGQEQRNTLIRNIVGSGLGTELVFMEMDSLNASLKFPDGYFHAVFIDSGHTYELTKAEIRLWHRKVMDGWILSGHDIQSHVGVKNAVSEVIGIAGYDIVETSADNGVWCWRKDPSKILK